MATTQRGESNAHLPMTKKMPWLQVASVVLFTIVAVLTVFLVLQLAERLSSVTCSMYHNRPLESWWPTNAWRFENITKEEFARFPFPNGLTQAEAKLINVSPWDVQVGDVLAFWTHADPPVIAHRVIDRVERNRTVRYALYENGSTFNRTRIDQHVYFSTIGDNAEFQMAYERGIGAEDIVGLIVRRPDASSLVQALARAKCANEMTGARAART